MTSGGVERIGQTLCCVIKLRDLDLPVDLDQEWASFASPTYALFKEAANAIGSN